jgi:hypothetical protein
VLSAMILVCLVWSAFHLAHIVWFCISGGCISTKCGFILRSALPLVGSLILLLMWWYTRQFAIAVQNRAIHTEESLRHFIMTGNPLDSRLTYGQVIALRFAGDDEYLALAARAVNEQMKPGEIKKAIKNWRADNHRC